MNINNFLLAGTMTTKNKQVGGPGWSVIDNELARTKQARSGFALGFYFLSPPLSPN